MTNEEEHRMTRKGMLAAMAGGVGALLLLNTGKKAYADSSQIDVRLINKSNQWINPATEDTLALIKTNTTGLAKSTDILNVAQSGVWTVGRNWTITETVPISHANLDAALSTLSKSNQFPVLLVGGRLDVNVGATVNPSNLDVGLSLIKAKTDNLDVLLSTIPNVSDRAGRLLGIIYGNLGQLDQRLVGLRNLSTGDLEAIAGTALTARDWSTDFSKLDVALSTRLKIADYVITQELGKVGIILAAGGAIIDPRDTLDRAARLLGIVYGSQSQQLKQTAINFNLQTELATGATLYDARQIRTLTATDVVDAADRAARLVGIVYGNVGQLLQRAVSGDALVQLRTATTEYDARQTRTLTTADAVTATQGGAAAQSSRWPFFLSDGIAERIGQKTMAASVPVAIASDQSAISHNQTQATAGFEQPRKLVTYRANFRLAARPYALSNAFAIAGRTQYATIHHAVTAAKTVKLRHVWVAIESASAAAIVMTDLVGITTAPATGNPAITPNPANPGDVVAEATCLALPTTPATEGALQSFDEWNLGITGAASAINPPPDLGWRDLLAQSGGFEPDSESKLPTIRPSTLEGWAVIIDSNALTTVNGYVIMEFTEE